VESVLRVMPQTRFDADTFGVVTICLVVVLILLGLLCIIYSFYFRSRIRSQGCIQFSYFSGPWIIRITFILFVIWWGFGEVIRLSLWRRALDRKWQETVCKCYIDILCFEFPTVWVLLLGLSVLSKPEDFLFEALVLLAFLFEAFVGFIGDEFQVVGEFGQL
jgi:hypothetical protein